MGSETISRKWLDGEKACAVCGKTFKNIDREVGHVRTLYGSTRLGRREAVCYFCVEAQVQEHIYGTRQRLGFNAQA